MGVLATLIKSMELMMLWNVRAPTILIEFFNPRTTTIVKRRECHIFTLLIHFTCSRITHRCLIVIVEFSVANLLKLILGKYVSQKKMPKR